MKIAVFCGSKLPQDQIYSDEAMKLADFFVEHHIELIYGGAQIGIMGVIANRMLEQGGTVIGIMPHILADKEIMHTGLTETILVEDMSQRKNRMNEMADAFIAFPGGCGTMDEIFEVITLNQIGQFNKPCAFANIDHYYDGIKSYLNHANSIGFIQDNDYNNIVFEDNTKTLLTKLKAAISE